MRETLSRSPSASILAEIAPLVVPDAEGGLRHFAGELERMGFTLYAVDEDSFNPILVSAEELVERSCRQSGRVQPILHPILIGLPSGGRRCWQG